MYCVGGSPATFEQRAFAAAAWAGPGAAVSHSAAARLWDMVDATPAVTDVWTSRRRTRPPAGVCPHFTLRLEGRDHGKLGSIPLTSPARTLIDLATVLPQHLLEAALAKAIVERRVTARALARRLDAVAGRGVAGTPVLRQLLLRSEGRWVASSPLERRVALVLADPSLPPSCREHPVHVDGGVYYLDFAWPHFRIGVEADGRRWHSDARSFERDRVRHNALTAAGWKVPRVTDRQLADPAAMRRRVRELVVRG